jgi:hypothetical protein
MITIASVSPERVCAFIPTLVVIYLLCKTVPNANVADLYGFAIRHLFSNDSAVAACMITLEAEQTCSRAHADIKCSIQRVLGSLALQVVSEDTLKG